MAILVALQGPEGERQFPLKLPSVILGRQTDSPICLSAKAVSRQHAQLVCREDRYFLEDLESSNGTYINGRRIQPRVPVPLTEHDTVQIGPYVLALRPEPTVTPTEGSLVIRDSVSVVSLDQSVYNQAPAQKLQMVLEIAQHLARTLDMDTLLPKLLDQLMRLLPHADRCLILLLEGENLVVRGERSRFQKEDTTYPYSRTVVNRALTEGIGILSEDIKADQRFLASSTLTSINLHSLICVPLICQDGRRLGIIQMDRFRDTRSFRSDDLHLLTTVCHQVAIALDNASLHAELLREERLRQELVMAREIQQGFLPSDFEDFPAEGFELFACVRPAREVSGDLYDFIRLEDGRLAFFVGDVSGKGMPAALFMVAVRTLGRHLAAEGHSPSETLVKMNRALAEDNPSAMFVTLAHGIYDPPTGDMVLASGGHHLPLLRRADGSVEELAHRSGRLLGYQGLDLHVTDAHFALLPGDMLVFYTDGYIEARAASREMFGLERLNEIVRRFVPALSLSTCAEIATRAVHDFTGSKESQDDLTLLLLRRSPPALEDQRTDELLAMLYLIVNCSGCVELAALAVMGEATNDKV